MSSAATLFSRITRRASSEFASRLCTRPVVALNQRPIVSFSFDDVPSSAVSNGAAILSKHGVRGTFFIAGGLCGTTGEYRYLDRDQCRELHRQGHEIGCHTFSHPNLRWTSRHQLAREVALNRAFFADLADVPLDNFAYPSGATSLRRRLQLQGLFTSARSTAPGINAAQIDLDFLRAVELCHGHIDLAGVEAWIDAAIAANGWLIFVTHDVADAPSRWGCTPSFFSEVVERVTSSGCDVVPIRQALALVRGKTAPKTIHPGRQPAMATA